MSDIVQRLKEWTGQENICTCCPLILEASEEIERLQDMCLQLIREKRILMDRLDGKECAA